MRNHEIQSTFADWLLDPSESLDWEAKNWLDMEDTDCQGLVAKELIALENHGGGFLIFGFEEIDKRLTPDPKRPLSLKSYLADALNAIVKRRAEPAFHVDVSIQSHPISGETYPLARVAGGSKVPVRSKSETAKSLRNHAYYIRAPGPESREPKDAAEWDALVRRAVMNQREDIIAIIRNFAFADGIPSAGQIDNQREIVHSFAIESLERWKALNAALPEDANSKIRYGYFLFAAAVKGESKHLSVSQIASANEQARKYTGWPMFVSLQGNPKSAPKHIGSCLEAWLGAEEFADVGHVDFWRIHPSGMFFVLRGYQEDAERLAVNIRPGTHFDISLPVWRVGEFILRVAELSEAMFEPDSEITFQCQWTGLRDRELFDHRGLRMIHERHATDDEATASGTFLAEGIRDLLPEVVKSLTLSLYSRFQLFDPPASLFRTELSNMSGRTY